MKILLIAVMATNRVIGRDNAIPWHIPEELRFFKTTTMGHPIIMGRKTYESLPGPLPGRRNIVLSRDPDYQTPGTDNVTSLQEALALCKGCSKAFILGGTYIFAEALPLADGIILSVLDRAVEGDTYFPKFSKAQFQLLAFKRHEEGSEPFTVNYYSRVAHPSPK